MAEEFFIPKLGQTVEEVTLVKWLVEDGAKVIQGQPVMEVETDKSIFPVEANARGTIHIGPYKEGQVVSVLTVVAVIGKPEDKFEVNETEPSSPALESAPVKSVADGTALDEAGAAGGEKLFASPRARKMAAGNNISLAAVTPTGYDGVRITERDVLAFLNSVPKVSPVAQRMAAETGIDLRSVSGTGPGGRIHKKDIARLAQPLIAQSSFDNQQPEILERIPLKGVRAIIAEHLAVSVHTTARVALVTEADATELVTARTRIKEKVEQEWGFAPGYNDLLAKIVATALRQYPYMNARLAPDAIEILGHVNMGMAVDTERGLLVPVIRDADQKSLHQFGTEFRAMVERARNRRSLPDDLIGGTFTITNLGMYDVDAFTPIINLPEAAILGMGRIAPKVVAYHGEAVIRQMWTLSLVFDHRLTDGAPAARFLQEIKQIVEEPYLLLMA
ncbi:MAG: dihydrolipoamide acetyltransferase family protein [Anaerolineales bacterium]